MKYRDRCIGDLGDLNVEFNLGLRQETTSLNFKIQFVHAKWRAFTRHLVLLSSVLICAAKVS